ncbi:MAG: sigma 54-interacting transcriptional regulator [Firmicutes bacterium]|nr:sigma 54-interacting transcriptional regulator [Bacillota bacterium]
MAREDLIGSNMEELKLKGYINDSSILEVKNTKRETMRYIKTNKGDGLYSIANPVFDENGDLKYIICLSHSEQLYEEFLSHISAERRQLEEAVMFFSQQNSEILYYTNSFAVKNLYYVAKQIASFDSTVILTGETGSGKDILARYIHQNSNRANKLFIPVNCSAIPSELFEMEFFGYLKGSFTGALEQGKAGLFETAANGTLFLDEIGELPLSMQAKLLRVLEDGEFFRIGSNAPQKTDVRIISATNRDLKEMVRKGTFREDLYYRLSVVSLTVPSLRDRKSDIIPLAQHFLSLYNKKYSKHMKFADDALRFLEEYSWPGNIRELKNIVEAMAVSSQTSVISMERSIFNIKAMLFGRDESETAVEPAADGQNINSVIKKEKSYSLVEHEKDLILDALKRYNGNVVKAASKLGTSRQTLYRKIQKYGIDVKRIRQE